MVAGGAWAVYKSQSLILEILAPEAGMAEKQAAALFTGMVMGGASMAMTAATGGASAAAMAAGGAAAGGLAGGVASSDGAGSSGGNAQARNNDQNQAYRG